MTSKRRIRREKERAVARMCGNKVRYEKHGAALFAGRSKAERTGDTTLIVAYHCHYCKKFHWGHKWRN